MNYLLDTHAIIWLVKDSDKMPQKLKEIVKDPRNNIAICTISFWEIAIKISIGKMEKNIDLNNVISELRKNGFDFFQIEYEYLKGLSKLPFIHKDPFDRLIIATAIAENMTIISVDENIQKYDVSWIW